MIVSPGPPFYSHVVDTPTRLGSGACSAYTDCADTGGRERCERAGDERRTFDISNPSQITMSLDAAVASLAKGNTAAAKNQINAASNKVNALVRSHNLSAADGKKLTDSLAAIAAGI